LFGYDCAVWVMLGDTAYHRIGQVAAHGRRVGQVGCFPGHPAQALPIADFYLRGAANVAVYNQKIDAFVETRH
jgi:hypothetical protein